MLHDFSGLWILVLLNTLCGLCISAVLKHGDNMLRANARVAASEPAHRVNRLGERLGAAVVVNVVAGNAVVLYSTHLPELAPIIEMVALQKKLSARLRQTLLSRSLIL